MSECTCPGLKTTYLDDIPAPDANCPIHGENSEQPDDSAFENDPWLENDPMFNMKRQLKRNKEYSRKADRALARRREDDGLSD